MDYEVRLEVYNILGERIKVIMDEMQVAWSHRAIWDASNNPSGIYLYKLPISENVFTKRMTLLK
ncbi:MAG: hypothetical protein CO189_05135 [candidate division Zixibacteria bacterium CG_4_9_14_3_um_filter_46_8]|nr:MAG: hypothetical protein CO189_05135 [candidate division Zixibacteria bacterium CG_4_9_14_3_um_filter_46_8]